MRSPRRLLTSVDSGFGLVEVVVAMFLFSFISLAILPMLITGAKQSLVDQNLTAASQLVDARLDLVRSSGSTCGAIAALAGSSTSTTAAGAVVATTTTVADAAGNTPACPAASSAYPTTVTVSVAVARSSPSSTLAQASTLVYVNAR